MARKVTQRRHQADSECPKKDVTLGKLLVFASAATLTFMGGCESEPPEPTTSACIAEVPSCSFCGEDRPGYPALTAAYWCEDLSSVAKTSSGIFCVHPCSNDSDCSRCTELRYCNKDSPPWPWNGQKSGYKGTCGTL